MERDHAFLHYVRGVFGAFILVFSFAQATAAFAQDEELDEGEFAELFAPFNTKPPLYQVTVGK